MRSRLTALAVVLVALSVVTGTGAFDAVVADRSAVVDVAGDAEALVGLTPHTGPNGAYARVVDGRLTLDVSATAPNSDAANGPIFGGLGVNSEAGTDASRVFNVSNQGTGAVAVYITDVSPEVTFFTTTDGHGTVEGETNSFTLVPGRTMEVGFTVDTSGVPVGTRLLESLTVHAGTTSTPTDPEPPADGTDTDGDGLTDDDEVNVHGTDPQNPDTDGDGSTDGEEVDAGTDPLDPNSSPGSTVSGSVLLVGAPGANSVYLYNASAATLSGTDSLAGADAVFSDILAVTGGEFSVAVAGDVNGDGFKDYLIGAPDASSGFTQEGAVYVVYGSATETDISIANADVVYSGEGAQHHAGTSVAAGDLNGDALADIVIGAPGADLNGVATGAVYVVYGSPFLNSMNLFNADVKFTGQSSNARTGQSIAVGDFTGGGGEEILIGAPSQDNVAGTDAGTVYGVGGLGFFGTEPLGGAGTFLELTGEAPNDQAGTSVADAGDVNGDGIADFLVGAPGNDAVATDAGATYVVYGGLNLASGSLANADLRFTGEAATDQAGQSVAGAGDVDGDGVDDILVGSPFNDGDGNAPDAGAAYVVYGSANLVGDSLANADLKLTGEITGDQAGFSVAVVDDLDGDGFDDIVVGAPFNDGVNAADGGAAYVVYGSGSLTSANLANADAKLTGETANDEAGTSVSGGR